MSKGRGLYKSQVAPTALAHQALETVISKQTYRVLADITQEPRLDVALPLAVKDLLRLKLKETKEQREAFERHYGMDFAAFQQAWQRGAIADKYSYEVERDYREWEAAVTDEERLSQMLESLL